MAGPPVKVVRADDDAFIPSADDIRAFRADARGMEEFERLKGLALAGADGRAGLRYVRAREREAGRRDSSRAERMAELAAAARAKHRGVFAGLNAAPARKA